MAVPFAFANLSGNIALAKLDSNFNTPITIGNTSVLLGNTVTTLNNLTLANVTITSGTSNVTNVNVTNINVVNVTATLANVTTLNATSAFITTGNIATANVGNLTLLNALTVANGGTGLTSLPSGNVIIGNGSSSPTSVGPGLVGNVLTSTGSAWVSNAIPQVTPGGANTQIQFNNSGSFKGDANLTFSGSTTTAANLIVSNLTGSLAVFSSSTKQLVSNPITGTGSVVMNSSPIVTSPSLIAPALGSPISGNMAATTNIPVANATGFLAVGNGGTGLTTIPSGNVIIGNGTSALYGIAPGNAGNVLTSIGGVWTSNAAVGGGGTGNASPLIESSTVIANSYVLIANKNAISLGATTISPNVSVTVTSPDKWLVTSYSGIF
jgi:hypothetical protein